MASKSINLYKRNVILFEPETLSCNFVFMCMYEQGKHVAKLNSHVAFWLGGGDPNISGKWSLISSQ